MKKNKYFEDLKEGLTAAIDFEKGKLDLRTTELHISDVPKLSKASIKILREQMRVSQPLFAQLLGVSPAAVKAWEQGEKQPTGSAKRLMQIFKDHPEIVSDYSNLPVAAKKRA